MDRDDEVFELVNSDDEVIGREARGVVHARGLLHRAVYCWVLDPGGRVLIQRRSRAKKIAPGQWDLSVAEHLQPGEGYAAAAARGLGEELGIAAVPEALAGPLGPIHRRELREGPYHDVELVQSFVLEGWAGGVTPADGEVEGTRWVGVEELRAEVAAAPQEFTQWMREEGEELGWALAAAHRRGAAAAQGVSPAAAAGLAAS